LLGVLVLDTRNPENAIDWLSFVEVYLLSRQRKVVIEISYSDARSLFPFCLVLRQWGTGLTMTQKRKKSKHLKTPNQSD
jgi:hypothetical protein